MNSSFDPANFMWGRYPATTDFLRNCNGRPLALAAPLSVTKAESGLDHHATDRFLRPTELVLFFVNGIGVPFENNGAEWATHSLHLQDRTLRQCLASIDVQSRLQVDKP